jgi:hypothetical protein
MPTKAHIGTQSRNSKPQRTPLVLFAIRSSRARTGSDLTNGRNAAQGELYRNQ